MDALDPDHTVLEEALGHLFSDRRLLLQALTHRSWVNESRDSEEIHNERLEFLGDAVVDLAVGHLLMEVMPKAREGMLSKLRAIVVSEQGLADAGRNLHLGKYLRLGKGEEGTGGRDKSSLLADTLEALVGAVFVDAGFTAADRVVARCLDDVIRRAVAGHLNFDYKTRLQEVAQARSRRMPQYRVVEESGPDHEKLFTVEVSLSANSLATGTGSSKKEAEQAAASEALKNLEIE